MHRGYFAQALEDNPNDPMGSKFAPSVLAAYSSACSFVGLIESLFKQHPGLTERMWFLFTHVFSCAVGICPPRPSGSLYQFSYSDRARVYCREVTNGAGTFCSVAFGICPQLVRQSF